MTAKACEINPTTALKTRSNTTEGPVHKLMAGTVSNEVRDTNTAPTPPPPKKSEATSMFQLAWYINPGQPPLYPPIPTQTSCPTSWPFSISNFTQAATPRMRKARPAPACSKSSLPSPRHLSSRIVEGHARCSPAAALVTPTVSSF